MPGCVSSPAVDLAKTASVARYDYTVNAGLDTTALACTGSLGSKTLTVTLSAALADATVTATPQTSATSAVCVRTASAGVVFVCSGLPAGNINIIVSATKDGAWLLVLPQRPRAAGPGSLHV
jgi:hypothetical protein